MKRPSPTQSIIRRQDNDPTLKKLKLALATTRIEGWGDSGRQNGTRNKAKRDDIIQLYERLRDGAYNKTQAAHRLDFIAIANVLGFNPGANDLGFTDQDAYTPVRRKTDMDFAKARIDTQITGFGAGHPYGGNANGGRDNNKYANIRNIAMLLVGAAFDDPPQAAETAALIFDIQAHTDNLRPVEGDALAFVAEDHKVISDQAAVRIALQKYTSRRDGGGTTHSDDRVLKIHKKDGTTIADDTDISAGGLVLNDIAKIEIPATRIKPFHGIANHPEEEIDERAVAEAAVLSGRIANSQTGAGAKKEYATITVKNKADEVVEKGLKSLFSTGTLARCNASIHPELATWNALNQRRLTVRRSLKGNRVSRGLTDINQSNYLDLENAKLYLQCPKDERKLMLSALSEEQAQDMIKEMLSSGLATRATVRDQILPEMSNLYLNINGLWRGWTESRDREKKARIGSTPTWMRTHVNRDVNRDIDRWGGLINSLLSGRPEQDTQDKVLVEGDVYNPPQRQG